MRQGCGLQWITASHGHVTERQGEKFTPKIENSNGFGISIGVKSGRRFHADFVPGNYAVIGLS